MCWTNFISAHLPEHYMYFFFFYTTMSECMIFLWAYSAWNKLFFFFYAYFIHGPNTSAPAQYDNTRGTCLTQEGYFNGSTNYYRYDEVPIMVQTDSDCLSPITWLSVWVYRYHRHSVRFLSGIVLLGTICGSARSMDRAVQSMDHVLCAGIHGSGRNLWIALPIYRFFAIILP